MAWTPDSQNTASWSTDIEVGAPYLYNQAGLAYNAVGYNYNGRGTTPVWTPETKH